MGCHQAAALTAADLRASLDGAHAQGRLRPAPVGTQLRAIEFDDVAGLAAFLRSPQFAADHWERRAAIFSLPPHVSVERGLPVDSQALFDRRTRWEVGGEPDVPSLSGRRPRRNVHFVVGSFQAAAFLGGGAAARGDEVAALMQVLHPPASASRVPPPCLPGLRC